MEQLEYVKFFLFISCDIRLEAPILNIRIKKNYNMNKNNELILYSYGFYLNNMSYPLKLLGNSILKLLLIFRNKHRFLCDFYFKNFISSTFLSNDIILYKN